MQFSATFLKLRRLLVTTAWSFSLQYPPAPSVSPAMDCRVNQGQETKRSPNGGLQEEQPLFLCELLCDFLLHRPLVFQIALIGALALAGRGRGGGKRHVQIVSGDVLFHICGLGDDIETSP